MSHTDRHGTVANSNCPAECEGVGGRGITTDRRAVRKNSVLSGPNLRCLRKVYTTAKIPKSTTTRGPTIYAVTTRDTMAAHKHNINVSRANTESITRKEYVFAVQTTPPVLDGVLLGQNKLVKGKYTFSPGRRGGIGALTLAFYFQNLI